MCNSYLSNDHVFFTSAYLYTMSLSNTFQTANSPALHIVIQYSRHQKFIVFFELKKLQACCLGYAVKGLQECRHVACHVFFTPHLVSVAYSNIFVVVDMWNYV
mgnify:CR=1 FL=1